MVRYLKTHLKKFFEFCLGTETFTFLASLFYYRWIFPYVQVVTYHDTPSGDFNSFREQLIWYQKNYVNCDMESLEALLNKGIWKDKKPGLVISFDDGLKSNFDIALPLLEEFGFTGWLMVPSGLVDLDPDKQKHFCEENLIGFTPNHLEKRIGMSWQEIKDARKRGHVVTCHSMNHKRLADTLSPLEIDSEIKKSKNLLEKNLLEDVDTFTWVGGEEWSYGFDAFRKMIEVGYKYIFCTNCKPISSFNDPYFLERYHVESWANKKQLRFILKSGIYEVLYFFKRKRLKKKLYNR
ncbi:polysaccharide deacetylase family protein [Leptospira brenneri]|uniref:Polysaccharide deacetylase family protein n=1 Tax=Leptospira brenneri TaxID=2023182 RepID=A0A2M9Y1Q4_9LEPT|nr:polysaccharide deacetylase family protein [Leptospira brenneri]PJZ45504.1 hypothetical protein CH361_10790 [Leptospira brenneri]TGK91996.1 polysaccharide deacetylase family protein [Leptospira brenneri]